jgi:aconitase A
MVGAGILARKAVERGLRVPAYVKTSLAPGSQVVTRYLDNAELTPYLEALGFHTVGYGCTTCIGNSGPLPEAVADAVDANQTVVASVISGNRNFEGRVHPQVRASFLASPPLVVAYALAGSVDLDIANDPLGYDPNGTPVYLADIWPTQEEIRDTIASSLDASIFDEEYSSVFAGDEHWQNLPIPTGQLYEWDQGSTYVQEPPFFENIEEVTADPADIEGAQVLALLPDSVTTDHISPAGSIAKTSPAAEYLQQLRFPARQPRGDDPRDLRQHPAPEPAGPGPGGQRHPLLPGGPRDDDLGSRDALPGGRHTTARDRGQGIRHRVLPGLGGQGDPPAWSQGRAGRELRAHPPQQPGRHGRPAAPVPAR